MKRAILLTVGWLLAAAGLYVALVGLELYWNLYDWQPRLDLNASGFDLWDVRYACRDLVPGAGQPAIVSARECRWRPAWRC